MASSSSSSGKPEYNMSVLLTPVNVMKLKHSVAALCDSEFNPQGVGILDITEKGFEITVRKVVKPITDTIGYLFLDGPQMLNFHCNKPIANKIISLNLLYRIVLEEAFDQGTSMTIFHLDDFTTNLSFKFGRYPSNAEVAIEFYDNDTKFEKFSGVIESCCKTYLRSTVLVEMIQRLQETTALDIVQLISINISKKQVAILVELSTGDYSYVINTDNDEFEATVEIPGKVYNAMFRLFFLESTMKATSVAPRFYLHFLTKTFRSFGNVMIQFNIETIGKLVFIHQASLTPDELFVRT